VKKAVRKRYIHLPLIVVFLLIFGWGCTSNHTLPFELDPEAGLLHWRGAEDVSLDFRMELNSSNPLLGAFTFREKDRVICINTVGDLDMIVELAGDTHRGTLQMRIKNPGKENSELFSVSPVIVRLPLHPELEIRPVNNPSWTLIRESEESRWTFSLDLGNSPLVLLPEEEIVLPELEFSRK
jgi:hypothetical protein